MSDHLVDLDELILRCKDKTTREYIQEAVSCYRVGAFRSCIVSTWNAVVFDVLFKLRQLELTGDKRAKELLARFETLRLSNNPKELWNFEISIPELAQELEFISPIECQDLGRLNLDRNRCAHPSMQSLEEPFQATPELARYHLRNAIIYLLQHPPVQGKVALNHILKDIESEFFPEQDKQQAIQIFKSSPLGHARKALVRNIIIVLTKRLLVENEITRKQRNRVNIALEAISELYFADFHEVIKTELPKIIDSVPDVEWYKVFNYLRRMQVWEALNERQRVKAQICLKNIQNLSDNYNAVLLVHALEIPIFESAAFEKINEFNNEDLTFAIEIIDKNKIKLKSQKITEIIFTYKNYTINKFIESKSFATSSFYGKKLLLISTWLLEEELIIILQAFWQNDQIYSADREIPEIMVNLFEQTTKTELVKESWLLVKQKIDERKCYTTLLDLIDNIILLS
ncbi:hypothetical protein [Synechocystis sp. PCC 7509]|uniref:hypothetical protein n=1 Tax=Synechocystis sp. PCC 7509 TaxID=927677 RepID=UPI0002AD0C13|nr:hypothetical protein [Synechocystis sp. PCC 7509]